MLRALDLDLSGRHDRRDPTGTAAEAAAPVLQAAALLRGDADLWAGQSDEALLAQGRASAQGPPLMARFVFPALPGLLDALGRPGARMLDVGTGVGGLAVAYAETFPAVTVVGIDVMPRVLALAAETVAAVPSPTASSCGNRTSPPSTSRTPMRWPGCPRRSCPRRRCAPGPELRTALVPGGWLVMGHGKFGGDPVEDAVGRFKTVAYGGTALDDGQAATLLRDAGFDDVRNVPTPPGAPALTVGRRPAR